MNRIDQKFAELEKKKQKALITFITAGDPNLETTKKLIFEMESKGADLIEIGIPFSDPIAEGHVILAASQRALNSGTNLEKVFEMVKEIRLKVQVPLLFMMYINTIFQFGKERFFDLCVDCGVDGVIVPDMPFEEKEEIRGVAEKAGVYSICLVTPTSHQERIKKIAEGAKGFLYCVSSTGVTGVRDHFTTDFESFFGIIHQYSKIPTVIGFGISTSQQIVEVKDYCDGVVVGSAIVRIVGEGGQNSIQKVGRLVEELKNTLKKDLKNYCQSSSFQNLEK